MRFLEREIGQLEQLARASSFLEQRSRLSMESANGVGGFIARFREQQLTRARRRANGARRLRKRIALIAESIKTKATLL